MVWSSQIRRDDLVSEMADDSSDCILVGDCILRVLLASAANRMGFEANGGPFNLVQLKVIQEVITLLVFAVFSMIAFHTELRWNHFIAALCLIAAVYFVFGFK